MDIDIDALNNYFFKSLRQAEWISQKISNMTLESSKHQFGHLIFKTYIIQFKSYYTSRVGYKICLFYKINNMRIQNLREINFYINAICKKQNKNMVI